VGSAFALIRFAVDQARAVSDRFVTFLEGSLRRQEDLNRQFAQALERLTENVRENSAVLARVAEALGIDAAHR
jgi:uncharacterized protein YigA (DUF484 family)